MPADLIAGKPALGHASDHHACGNLSLDCAAEISEQCAPRSKLGAGYLLVAVPPQLDVAAAVRNLPAMVTRLAVRFTTTASHLRHMHFLDGVLKRGGTPVRDVRQQRGRSSKRGQLRQVAGL